MGSELDKVDGGLWGMLSGSLGEFRYVLTASKAVQANPDPASPCGATGAIFVQGVAATTGVAGCLLVCIAPQCRPFSIKRMHGGPFQAPHLS